jgi:O-antigen ligase
MDFLKNYVKTGEFLILFVFFSIIYNNIMGYEGALAIMTLFVIYLASKNKYVNLENLKNNKNFMLFIYIVVAYFFIKFFSILINQCCFEDASQMYAKYSKILYLIPFILLLKYLRFDFDTFSRFLLAISYIMVLMAFLEIYFIGIAEYHGVVFSEIGELAWFVGTILFSTIILSFYYLYNKNYKLGLQFVTLSMLLFVLLILTNVRGYWLSFLITLFILMVAAIPLFDLRLRKYGFSLIVFFIALIFVVLSFDNKISNRISSATKDFQMISSGDYTGSIGQRLFMFNVALEGIKEKPLIGLGESNYKPYFANLYEINKDSEYSKVYSLISGYQHVHNQYLMDFWMMGVFGFLLLIVLLLYPLYFFIKNITNSNNNVIAFLGMSFLISSMGIFMSGAILTYSHGFVFFFFWLVMICYLFFSKNPT